MLDRGTGMGLASGKWGATSGGLEGEVRCLGVPFLMDSSSASEGKSPAGDCGDHIELIPGATCDSNDLGKEDNSLASLGGEVQIGIHGRETGTLHGVKDTGDDECMISNVAASVISSLLPLPLNSVWV